MQTKLWRDRSHILAFPELAHFLILPIAECVDAIPVHLVVGVLALVHVPVGPDVRALAAADVALPLPLIARARGERECPDAVLDVVSELPDVLVPRGKREGAVAGGLVVLVLSPVDGAIRKGGDALALAFVVAVLALV